MFPLAFLCECVCYGFSLCFQIYLSQIIKEMSFVKYLNCFIYVLHYLDHIEKQINRVETIDLVSIDVQDSVNLDTLLLSA